ncbi:MAG: PKD domain-containing protein [bacterium]|nr:PKD domain-containing protein [bacterium]
MKISRISKIRFLGFSLILIVALGIVVNIATANTPQTGREEISVSVEEPQLAQEVTPEVPDVPQFTQTSCAMAIDDLGDNNPFTYSFSATNVNNIASYAWNFGDSTLGSGTPAPHTYTATGTFNITLTCTPTAGFGSDIVLTGSISVTQPPAPGFYLTPGQVVSSSGAVTFNAINTSSPAGLTYDWCVTTSAAPPVAFDAGNCPLYYATSTDASYNQTVFGVPHYFYLRATNAGGQSAVASLSFVVQATQPTATFTVTPQIGAFPLDIFVDGTDLMTGPLFPGAAGWQYTVTGPGGPYTFTTQDFNMTGLAVGSYTIRLDYAGPGGSGFRQQTVVVYAVESTVNASFTVEFEDNVAGGRRVCFTNTSTGEYQFSYWDFDNALSGNAPIPAGGFPASPNTTPEGGNSNASRVCYVYDSSKIGTNLSVRLRVEGNDPGINSNAIQTFVLQLKPTAHFTWTPGSPTWGQWVTFNPDTSTGQITNPSGYDWQFDFNNDGTIDATRDNVRYPGDVQLPVGPTRVILTVTGPQGSDTYEDVVVVTRRDLTCNAIGGTFFVTPAMGAQNYTSNVTGANGPDYGTRTVSYSWTITPNSTPPLAFPITTQNLTGIDWSTFGFGSFNISLIATTADGASCTVDATVVRDWTPIQCSATGNSAGSASFYASSSPVTFSTNFNSGTLNGRTILGYEWFVNGVSQGAPSLAQTTFVRNYTNPVAAYNETIRYQVYVDNDGSGTFVPALDANCFEDLTVTINPFPLATCSINNPFMSPQYADGLNYTMTASGGNLFGRPVINYDWYVTFPPAGEVGPVQSGASNTYTHTMTTDRTNNPDFSYRVEITVDNGNGTFDVVSCNRGVGVDPYPAPTCSLTGGSNNPLPVLGNTTPPVSSTDTSAAQHNNTYTMNFNLATASGIVVGTRTWAYSPANLVSGGGVASDNVTVNWNAANGSLPPGTPQVIDLTVAWTYPDLTTDSINCVDRNVNVRVPSAVCNAPIGDTTPLPGDNNIYTRQLAQSPSLGHGNAPIYGRANFTTWYLEIEDLPLGSNTWTAVLDPVAADTDGTPGSPYVLANETTAIQQLNFSAFLPDRRYRISYRLDITNDVIDTCTSGWVTLNAVTAGTGFTCDLFPNAAPNVFTVPDATGNRVVRVNVDNGNGYTLRYDYYLVGPGATQNLIYTTTSALDGNVDSTILRTAFAPPSSPTNGNVGNYNMRVDVTYVSGGVPPTTTSCSLNSPQRYIVGAVDSVLNRQAYPGGQVGFAVGTCFTFTNASVTNSGSALGDPATNLLYNWTISGGGTPADNNYATNAFSTYQLPGCISFGTPGNYTMTLGATNDFQGDTNFRQQDSATNNFRICALQGMGVTRNGSSGDFAFTNQSFTASGFGELTGNYTFTVRDAGTNAIVLGPTTQAGANFSFNSLGGGNYYLEVTQGGCLGTAYARVDFSLIPTGGIIARYNFRDNLNAGVAPLTVCFNDTSVSNGSPITLWEWDWENNGSYDYSYVTYESQATLCHTYAAAGVYYPLLQVTNGAGQQVTAQNPVRVYTALEGQMSFNASPLGGGQWCYTPNMSLAPAGTIVQYWEFNANQLPTPTQTPAVGVDGAGVICHTYGAAGTYYVNMCFTGPAPANEPGCVMRPIIVELPGGGVPTLTGNGSCSVAQTATFTVNNTSGNAMTSPAQVIFYNNGTPYSYQTVQLGAGGSRTFTFPSVSGVIRMVIGDYGVDTGASVVCTYPPILNITSQCGPGVPSLPVFTLNNADEPAGDNPMLTTQAYTIFNNSTNAVVGSGNLPLVGNGPASLQISALTGVDPYVGYRIVTTGSLLTQTLIQNPCNPAPVLSVSRSCANPTQFTITNTGGDLVLPQSFEVVGTPITGVIPAGAGGTPMVVNLTGVDPYAGYTVQTTGATQGFATLNSVFAACTQPTFNVTRTCANPTEITINSTLPLAVDQGFEVVGNPSINGTMVAGASSLTLTLTGLDPYGTYQVTTNTAPNGFLTYLSNSTACTRPDLVITHDCANPVTFTVTNNGGNMLMPSTVNYVTGGGSISPTTIQLASGASEVITVSPSTLNPYTAYEININDFNTNGVAVVDTRDCLDPVLTVTNNTCATYPLTFTVTNTGGTMAIGQLYEIRNSANVVVLSGTLNIAGTGGTQLITMTGINPYDTYTISSTGFAGSLSGSVVNACTAPVLSAVSTCGYPATFTISNTGGDMITTQTFAVTHKDGTDVTGDVTPAGNTFDINNGGTFVVTLDAAGDPYGLYTLTSSGFAGGVTNTQDCELPQLQVTSSCLFPVQFLVKNVGAPMLVDHTFTVTNTLGFDLTPAPGFFNLATDEVYLVDIPVTDLSLTISFATNTYGIFNTTQVTCISGGGVTKNPVVDLGDDPLAPTITPISIETILLNRLSPDVLGLPAWAGVPTCGHGCPIFRLYHTNQSGDWDIWRLDGADMEAETSFHTNLTELDSVDGGNAENVIDISPSLSPNNDYFVFSSDRDGNWEIYVAPTDGDLNTAQRVTFNETAIDTDPTWGPNNYIVYESSRNGNWDLVMVDVTTGVEYQVTDSPSNEMNPAWSPDGSKILYQSDVNSSPLIVDWQVFELDLTTMTVRRLTSEEFGAVDPAYSPDGNRIVYRTHTAMTDSVIKVMNGDLSGNVAVTSTVENATTPVFSPSGRYLAYQSNADGDLDIYVHEFATGLTRKLTDNTIDDFAPTWLCGDDRLVFTSEIYGNPDIFEVDVEPITASPILVEEDAFQLTFEEFNDVYPMMNQPEENASREDQKVMEDTQYQRGLFRTGFSMTPQDSSVDFGQREDWAELNVCPASDLAIGGGG